MSFPAEKITTFPWHNLKPGIRTIYSPLGGELLTIYEPDELLYVHIPDDTERWLRATLERDAHLAHFDVRSTVNGVRDPRLNAKEFYTMVLNNIWPQVYQVHEQWYKEEDEERSLQFKTYMEAKVNGLDPLEAAKRTWSGTILGGTGFQPIEVKDTCESRFSKQPFVSSLFRRQIISR